MTFRGLYGLHFPEPKKTPTGGEPSRNYRCQECGAVTTRAQYKISGLGKCAECLAARRELARKALTGNKQAAKRRPKDITKQLRRWRDA